MNFRRIVIPCAFVALLAVAGCRRGRVLRVVAPTNASLRATRVATRGAATLSPTRPASTPTGVLRTATPMRTVAVPAATPAAAGGTAVVEETPDRVESPQRPSVLFGNDVPLLEDAGTQPDVCRVANITMMGSGHAPDWSWDGRFIAYSDMVGDSYEVFIMDADGADRRCLTCDGGVPSEFEGKHKGKATFYPGGRYLLFSVENESGDHGLTTIPGIGEHHDFWITDLETGAYWRLTTIPEDSATQYPRFSSDGTKLLWSQRYEKARLSLLRLGREWGVWTMKLADFSITPDGPELTHVVDLEPGGEGYYEPHGFSPDGSRIIFTGMIRPEKSAFYGEIYTLTLATNELNLLAQSDDIHFEMALYSPGGSKISFMSGAFLGVLEYGFYKTDLYLMDADGSNRVRLTHFSEPGHPDYVGAPAQIQKEAWSPDGSRIIGAYLNHDTRESHLFMIQFAGACGGP